MRIVPLSPIRSGEAATSGATPSSRSVAASGPGSCVVSVMPEAYRSNLPDPVRFGRSGSGRRALPLGDQAAVDGLVFGRHACRREALERSLSNVPAIELRNAL